MPERNPDPLTCPPSRPTEISTEEETMQAITASDDVVGDRCEYDDGHNMAIVNEEMESDNKATPFNRTFNSNPNCVVCHHEPGGTSYRACDYCPAVLCLHCARNLQGFPPALGLLLHDGCQLPSQIGRQFESLPNCRECGQQVYRGESHETCVRCTSCVHSNCEDPNHPHTHNNHAINDVPND